ncbi:SMI1/KNR4 family protein [Streptomyces abyssomicinicus]|uniref:SMI1/KNR4 family protein n=1 Tax=Streptomyces abyssomicinicus TaxID=574929 RepID=UPI00124F86FC|nr:SMI1/KNR4 family protein [Streptomyces abyssomicinicus]
MIEQVMRRMAERIAARAPEGWTGAVVSGRAGRDGGARTTGRYTVPGGTSACLLSSASPVLRDLAQAARAERGWRHVSWEVECLPSGEFRHVVFTDAVCRLYGSTAGYLVEVDGAYVPPRPGTDQEAGRAAPAGEPQAAAAALRACLERRAAALGRTEPLPPPATAEAVEEAERRIGRALPADLRALYLIADGDGHLHLLHDKAWLSLEELVAEYEAVHGLGDRPPYDWDRKWDEVVLDAAPAGTVRRCGSHPGWVPFATAFDGNFLAVDTAPARDGRPGQVIRTGRDHDDGPSYVADSVTAVLREELRLLDEGSFEVDDDTVEVHRPSWSAHAETGVYIGGGVPDEVPATLQDVRVNAPGRADLAPLTAAPRLRRLHLGDGATTADLRPLRNLPVESLRVTLDGGDLTPLEGHPFLRSLELRTTVPVSLDPLRSVPGLRGLDLCGAEVTDPSVLGDLAQLRFLSLEHRRWATLLAHGRTPPRLAAARIRGDEARFTDALDLGSRLGLDTSDAIRGGGRL